MTAQFDTVITRKLEQGKGPGQIAREIGTEHPAFADKVTRRTVDNRIAYMKKNGLLRTAPVNEFNPEGMEATNATGGDPQCKSFNF